jgi:hypothetical protein
VRRAAKTAVALTLLLAACGGSALSLEEYVERMQTTTDELEAMGEQFAAVVEAAVDLETGAVVDVDALQGLLDDTAAALEGYFEELESLEAPSEVADAHDAFVTVAKQRVEQWVSAADRASEIESLDELVAATLKTPDFTGTCMALEQAVDDNGLRLDMDCD